MKTAATAAQPAHRPPPPETAEASERVVQNLKPLLKLDPRLIPVSQIAGTVRPRSRPAGFEGLARVICGQQLSVASADAIWGRMVALSSTQSPQAFLDLPEDQLRGAGLSRNKYVTMAAVARAIQSRELNLDDVANLPAREAVTLLTQHKGIGPWTAEIYLMFCAAHPDIFPAGDLALRKAVGEGLDIDPAPSPAAVTTLAAGWAPYRSTAALLFWQFYAARRQRKGLPI